MTILIGLGGSPSVGKSTTAAKLFACMKEMGLSVELVTEFCKSWVWDQREITPYSELYFFGKQSHAESRLFNKVDYIITDSPTYLAAFYQKYYNGNNCLSSACKEFYKRAAKDNIRVLNFLLTRQRPYVTKGRLQTQEEADEVAVLLKEWLEKESYPYEELTCPDEERVKKIIERLKEITGGFDGMALV